MFDSKPEDFWCIAHRGSQSQAPENTLSAVASALRQGCPWIHISAQAVEDELFALHDQRLDRTTDGSGHIYEVSASYVGSLEVGDGGFIPTVAELIDLVNHRARVNVELRSIHGADLLVDLLQDYIVADDWKHEDFLVSSFDQHALMRVKQRAPELPIGLISAGVPLHYAEEAARLGAYSVHVPVEFVSREYVEDAHTRGLLFFAYVANHPDDFERMRALGVDGVYSDFPDRYFGSAPGPVLPAGFAGEFDELFLGFQRR